MNAIDIHHHFLPPRLRRLVGEDAIAGLLVSGGSLSGVLKNPSKRWTAILSTSQCCRSPHPGVCTVSPVERESLTRHCNEYAATLMQGYPRRFGSFATAISPSSKVTDRRPGNYGFDMMLPHEAQVRAFSFSKKFR